MPVYIHATWWLLLAGFSGWAAYEGGWMDAVWTAAYMILIFACILMHEFGHIEAARYFGFRTLYVVMLPIGGMARFASLPRRPRDEIIVALAGPAVNVLIIIGLCLWLQTPPWAVMQAEVTEDSNILALLVMANVALATFNLIPIFPMDGGRVLRALLALRLPFVRATFWAATVAKGLAVVGAAYVMLESFNPFALVLLLFVVWAGDAEYRAAVREDRLSRSTIIPN